MADADPATYALAPPKAPRPLRELRVWRRRHILDGVDRPAVLVRIHLDAGWSSRYAFMVSMSAGIAILGLLLSSPAVIIGAMLISPLMGPIIGLGFALATFDWAEVRKSLVALALGTLLAVGFTALVVQLSPLQDITTEILARTRPNLFDLLVAIFSALAGAYATVRGRGETIVGVAIATALMPPLAVVGFGLATANLPIFLGAFALYATNFIAIALSATAVARFYGFGAELSPRQSRQQAVALVIVLATLAVPLAVSLRQIAWEAWATRTGRNAIEAEFGSGSRVGSFEPTFGGEQVRFRATVFTDRIRDKATADLERQLASTLERPVDLRLSQILVNDGTQRAELDRARDGAREATGDRLAQADLAARLAYMTGAAPEAITIDPVARRAIVRAGHDLGLAELARLEARARADDPAWDIRIVPPLQALPPIHFAAGSAVADAAVQEQARLHLWALQRWGAASVGVSGGRATSEPGRLSRERADAVGTLLMACGVRPVRLGERSVSRALQEEVGLAKVRSVWLVATGEAESQAMAETRTGDDSPAATPCLIGQPMPEPEVGSADAGQTEGKQASG